MKARSALEKAVVKLSGRIPQDSLTQSQLEWLCRIKYASYCHPFKGKFWCPNCGEYIGVLVEEVDKIKGIDVVCPHCGSKLKTATADTNYVPFRIKPKIVCRNVDYVAFATRVYDFQVIRYFVVRYESRLHKKLAVTEIEEVVRTWSKKGCCEVVESVGLGGIGCYWWDCPFSKSGDLSLKSHGYNIDTGYVYPRSTWSKDYIRFGLYHVKDSGSLLSPAWLHKILSDDHALTILQKGWYSLLQGYMLKYGEKAKDELFDSIKIAIRNNYGSADTESALWIDYIGSLKKLGLDVRNAHYVCPEDLNAAHDSAVRRISMKEMKEKLKELSEDNRQYTKRIDKFKGIVFACDDVEISPLKSLYDFKYEGDKLHHCVFTNEYYKKNESLIMSARRDGIPIETIEVSLDTYKILQCHGDHNHMSELHQQILDTVTRNMSAIKRANKKRAKTTNICSNVS